MTFKAMKSMESVTNEVQTFVIDDSDGERQWRIVDSPGLADPKRSQLDIWNQIIDAM